MKQSLLAILTLYLLGANGAMYDPHYSAPKSAYDGPWVIVFRSGHKMLINDYKLHGSGKMITVEAEDRTHMIPIHIIYEIRKPTTDELAEMEAEGKKGKDKFKQEPGDTPSSGQGVEEPDI